MVKKQSAQKSAKKKTGAGAFNPTAPVLIPFTINPKHPHFWKMNFLPERGYDMKNAHPSFEATIQSLQWEGFVQHRTYYLEQIVREFYAGLVNNAGEIQTGHAVVRGKKVFFDEETINRFYNLQYSGNDFDTKIETYGKKKMEQIKNRIAVPNAPWEKITHTECKMKIRYLVSELSNWHTFINCSIMPTSHNYTLSKDRLIILDSILTDENINIGRIINKEIRDCARKSEGFLFFPCLITALCMKHKVPINEHEHSQRKYPPSALSAQMKARKIITNPEELKKEKKKGKKEEEVQKHEMLKPDDSKWKAIRNYLWEQHEFLEARLAEISQTPTCLEMPEFPIWVFDDIDDEEEKDKENNEENESDEEEEVIERKKKELKRKKETVRKGKAKKKKIEEVVISESEETEEEDEVEKEMKEMEKQTDEEEEDTATESSEKAGDEIDDFDLNLSLEEILRKKKGKQPVLEQIIPPKPKQPAKQPTPPSTGTTPPPPESTKKVAADVTQEETPNSPTIEKDPPTHQTQETIPPQDQNEPLFPANIVFETGTQEKQSEVPTQEVAKEQSVPTTTDASAPSASAQTEEPPVIRVTENLEDILRLVAVELAVKKRQDLGNTQKFFKSTPAATTQTTMEQGGGSKQAKEKEPEKTTAEEEETALKDIAETLKDLPDQVVEPSAEISMEPQVQSGAQAPDAQAPTPAQPSKTPAVKASASASKTPKAAKQKPKVTPTRSSNRLRSGAKPQ